MTEVLSTIEIFNAEAEQFLLKETQVQILGSGFIVTEGPLWLKDQQKLLFSETKHNTIYSWTEKEGIQTYLHPSGYTGKTVRTGEMGSNGLVLSPEGKLIICQHGNRCVAEMQAPMDTPKADFRILAHAYKGKKLNSPNDIVCDRAGNYYFTDPIYGLEKGAEDPSSETNICGVYRIRDSGLELLIDSLTRPNGIILSNDESKLYVANSDAANPVWMVYDLRSNGTLTNGNVFYDAVTEAKTSEGLPDGLCMNSLGYIFATGPGGIWVFNPEGKHIASIRLKVIAYNVTLDDSESYLYITANMHLLRLKLNK